MKYYIKFRKGGTFMYSVVFIMLRKNYRNGRMCRCA
jgi:hypothetical protein